jgi:hypothetical protein
MTTPDFRASLDAIRPTIVNGHCLCCGDKADGTGGCSMCTSRTFDVRTGQLLWCACGRQSIPSKRSGGHMIAFNHQIELIGRKLSYPNPVNSRIPPHVGIVLSVRESNEVLVLLEGKKIYVPVSKCTEIAP